MEAGRTGVRMKGVRRKRTARKVTFTQTREVTDKAVCERMATAKENMMADKEKRGQRRTGGRQRTKGE